MPSSIINSDDGLISGTAGIKTTGGDDGVLIFQKNGTETARIAGTGNLEVVGAVTFNNGVPAISTGKAIAMAMIFGG